MRASFTLFLRHLFYFLATVGSIDSPTQSRQQLVGMIRLPDLELF